jgi:hypothetical protein
MKECKNCGVKSNGKYCYNCGQEIDLMRLDTKTVFHEIIFKGIFHWENSKLKTFKRVLISPGNSVSDYISGKREAYVKPFIYFFTILTAYVLVFHGLGGRYYEYLNTASENRTELIQMEQVILSYTTYFTYLLPVFLSLYVYLFLKKSTGINYAESIVASLYWIGTSLVFSIFFMVLSLIDPRIWNAGTLSSTVFLVFAIMQFTGQKNLKSFFTGLVIVVLSYTTYLFVVLIIIEIYFHLTGSDVKVF